MGMAGIYLEKMSPPSRFRERCIYGHVVRPLLTNNIGMLRSYTICSTPVFLLYFLIMKNLQSRAAEKIAERLSWCTAKRDQAGLSFFWHILPVILKSQALMRLIGFNGREVRNGTSSRGLSKRKETPEIRGPLCPDSIAGYIQAITAVSLERCFNGII